MAEQQLPQQINVLRMAEQGTEFSGQLPVAKMSRLRDMLQNDQGEVAVQMSLGKDEEGLAFIRGELETNLTLECQRCLQAVDVAINDSFLLSPVENDAEADRLPSHYEPLLIDRDQQFLSALVEDELILRLPIVPLHDTEQCHTQEIIEEIDNDIEQTDNNPFQELSKLK